jgi:alpha-1,2-mannosyltransferase
VVGTLLITPYVLDYDLVLLAAPIAWLAMEGLKGGFLSWEKSILFLAWLLPMWSRWIGMLYAIPLGPVVLTLTMIVIIRRVAFQARLRPVTPHVA